MQFSDIIGHQSIKEHLASAIKENRIAHAQLFLGNEGTGALPLALAYASMVNCLNPKEHDSCGECNSCKKSAHYMHADIHFTYPTISPAKLSRDFITDWRSILETNPYMGYQHWLQKIGADNKQGNITAEETKDIVRRLGLKQVEGKFKIQIIWGAEYLSKEGNKLLKILEEPPENTLFLLIAEDSDKILPTILSRTQVLKIPHLTAVEITDALVKEKNCDVERASHIASIASGNWNIAVDFLEHSDLNLLQQLKTFLNGCLSSKDRKAFLAQIDTLAQSGRESLKLFLEYFLMVIEKSAAYKYTGVEPPLPGEDEVKFINKFSERIDPDRIHHLIDDLNKSHFYIERNANPKLVLFNLYLSVRNSLS